MRTSNEGGFPTLGDDSNFEDGGVDENAARHALEVIESYVRGPLDRRAVKQALGFEAYMGMYLTSQNSKPRPIRREVIFRIRETGE